MKWAIFSDIHGHLGALEAVLADIDARGGVDGYWALGDLVALGPNPLEVLDRLEQLPQAYFVRGNTDRYVTTGDRPYPWLADVHADPTLAARFAEVEGNFAWTTGVLAAAARFQWLDRLPFAQRMTLPDGTRVLGVHASPFMDTGAGFNPDLSAEARSAFVAASHADLVFAGHTHWPMDETVDGTRVINLGSVGLPVVADLMAGYVILTADQSGYEVAQIRVPYDREDIVVQLDIGRNPSADFMKRFMRGQMISRWSTE